MLVVALASLLHGFSGDVLDRGRHFGQSGWMRQRLCLCSLSAESPSDSRERNGRTPRGFGIVVLSKQHLDNLTLLVDRLVSVTSAPQHFHMKVLCMGLSPTESDENRILLFRTEVISTGGEAARSS